VQCKYYSSPVGNKAVQEVYSAKDVYDAEQAWVVTNHSYTPAAKVAAKKLGVLLIHHDEIPDLLS
jgi:restriction system protein